MEGVEPLFVLPETVVETTGVLPEGVFLVVVLGASSFAVEEVGALVVVVAAVVVVVAAVVVVY